MLGKRGGGETLAGDEVEEVWGEEWKGLRRGPFS
jgi:hypothetical protein